VHGEAGLLAATKCYACRIAFNDNSRHRRLPADSKRPSTIHSQPSTSLRGLTPPGSPCLCWCFFRQAGSTPKGLLTAETLHIQMPSSYSNTSGIIIIIMLIGSAGVIIIEMMEITRTAIRRFSR
jgi:hypothetical protein